MLLCLVCKCAHMVSASFSPPPTNINQNISFYDLAGPIPRLTTVPTDVTAVFASLLCRYKWLILRQQKHSDSFFLRRLFTSENILTNIIFHFCHILPVDPRKSYTLDLQAKLCLRLLKVLNSSLSYEQQTYAVSCLANL